MALAILPAPCQHLGLNGFEAGLQNQIPVRDIFLGGQSHAGRASAILLHSHRVGWRSDFVQLQVARDREFEAHLVQRAKASSRNPGRITSPNSSAGNSISASPGAVSRCLRPGMISGSQRKRKTKAEAVVSQFHPAQDLQVHRHRLLRPDVPDREIHHAIPVLPRQRRERALALSLPRRP